MLARSPVVTRVQPRREAGRQITVLITQATASKYRAIPSPVSGMATPTTTATATSVTASVRNVTDAFTTPVYAMLEVPVTLLTRVPTVRVRCSP
ncbi:Uncharacterised protein [Micrococcus luteus]|nr:Uncharacterised protein [Micrococcus luteus]